MAKPIKSIKKIRAANGFIVKALTGQCRAYYKTKQGTWACYTDAKTYERGIRSLLNRARTRGRRITEYDIPYLVEQVDGTRAPGVRPLATKVYARHQWHQVRTGDRPLECVFCGLQLKTMRQKPSRKCIPAIPVA